MTLRVRFIFISVQKSQRCLLFRIKKIPSPSQLSLHSRRQTPAAITTDASGMNGYHSPLPAQHDYRLINGYRKNPNGCSTCSYPALICVCSKLYLKGSHFRSYYSDNLNTSTNTSQIVTSIAVDNSFSASF